MMSAATTSIEDESDELDLLLAAATDDKKQIVECSKQIKLVEDKSFAEAFRSTSIESSNIITPSTPSTSKQTTEIEKEFDSSDDEEVRNFLEQKYNKYGRDINLKLKTNLNEQKQAEIDKEIVNITKNNVNNTFNKNKPRISALSSANKVLPETTNALVRKTDLSNSFKPLSIVHTMNKTNLENSIFTDPIFGLKIINPLISSSVLIERMNGRSPISISGLQLHVERSDLTKDWVVAGAILNKSSVKTTKTGGSYSIWKITDMKGDMKTFALFIFKGAHKELWKTATGMCIAILNPTVFDKREERGDVACLSIDVAQKVMILGQSKDMGTCKAKKKNGEKCTKVVNLSECDFCVYHIKQEFNTMSKRSELQSSTSGRGLQDLRNKVLGKSEVFYGGQSFLAIPGKKSAKLTAKDNQRISSLSEYNNSPNAGMINHKSSTKSLCSDIPYAKRTEGISKVASTVELSLKQRLKDIERLKLLKEEENKFKNKQNLLNESNPCAHDEVDNCAPNELKKTESGEPNKFLNREFSFALNKIPILSKETFSIDFSNIKKPTDLAKLKAMQFVKKNPIKKSNPNFIKHRGTADNKKRVMEDLNEFYKNTEKRRKIEDDRKEYERKSRLDKIIAATSINSNLAEMRKAEAQEQYFNKMEKKEALEEKMLGIFQVPCKAVICLQCKYTAFSAAERCKENLHKFKVIDTEKRFFKCFDCENRTVTLHKLPTISCKNCQGSRWVKAPMIREKKLNTQQLSIRGDEEKFIGSLNSSTCLNLLMPDEE